MHVSLKCRKCGQQVLVEADEEGMKVEPFFSNICSRFACDACQKKNPPCFKNGILIHHSGNPITTKEVKEADASLPYRD